MFTDNFDVVPDREALDEMRGTTPTQDLRTDDNEFVGKATFAPTNFLLLSHFFALRKYHFLLVEIYTQMKVGQNRLVT